MVGKRKSKTKGDHILNTLRPLFYNKRASRARLKKKLKTLAYYEARKDAYNNVIK
jgi:hypothetical protein